MKAKTKRQTREGREGERESKDKKTDKRRERDIEGERAREKAKTKRQAREGTEGRERRKKKGRERAREIEKRKGKRNKERDGAGWRWCLSIPALFLNRLLHMFFFQYAHIISAPFIITFYPSTQ